MFFEEVRTPGGKTTDPYSKERRKLSTSRNRISFELAVTKAWSVCDHNLQEIESWSNKTGGENPNNWNVTPALDVLDN